jgi:hypothetical protein
MSMSSIIDINNLFSESFQSTRNGIQNLCKIITGIKSKQKPSTKNYEEHSLKISTTGLSTSPIPIYEKDRLRFLDISIDFNSNSLKITLDEERREIKLNNKSLKSIILELKSVFNKLSLPWNNNFQADQSEGEIFISDSDTVQLWSVLKSVYLIFLQYKSSILKEMSDINFWPHHFDLAMLLFSGKIIKGEDPNNWSYSREQMNFGFLFGDEYIDKPYFYVTVYPFNKELSNVSLPDGAYWYIKDWNGAILEMEASHLLNENGEIYEFFSHLRNIAPEQFYK